MDSKGLKNPADFLVSNSSESTPYIDDQESKKSFIPNNESHPKFGNNHSNVNYPVSQISLTNHMPLLSFKQSASAPISRNPNFQNNRSTVLGGGYQNVFSACSKSFFGNENNLPGLHQKPFPNTSTSTSTNEEITSKRFRDSNDKILLPPLKKFSSPEKSGQHSANVIRIFNECAPLFNLIDIKTFPLILVKVLRYCLNDIPLDEFYNFIYRYPASNNVVHLPVDGIKIDRSVPNESKWVGLEVCRLILQNFQLPNHGYFNTVTIRNHRLLAINFHEILRVFLTIKVIFDSVQIVEDTSGSEGLLTRASIYNAYYIICKKLIRKYPISCNNSELQSNLILCLSQFGKVFRLNFPGLQAERLGKRGQSKFCYRGIRWNELVVDEDIQRLAEMPLPDIVKSFEESQPENPLKPTKPDLKASSPKDFNPLPDPYSQKSLLSGSFSTKKPLYSFVDLSDTFPCADFSLFEWKMRPGLLPQQSPWSKTTMHKTTEALERHGIKILPLINKVQRTRFSEESVDEFLEYLLLQISNSMKSKASTYVHLNLFLVASLLLSQIPFASSDELSSKEQLCTSLKNFLPQLETNFPGISSQDRNNLMAFGKIVTKIISSINLLLAHVTTSLARRIISVMRHESQEVADCEEEKARLIYRVVFIACNALNWEFFEASVRKDSRYQANFIKNITNRYIQFTRELECQSEIPGFMIEKRQEKANYQLPLQIFSELTRIFHELFLSDPFVLQLPIKLIELLINKTMNEFQTASFNEIVNLDHGLSREIFKTWWVYSTAVQEHMSIISEVAALSRRVS